MKIAMVYTSVTGNTEALMRMIEQAFQTQGLPVDIYPIHAFDLEKLQQWDAIIVGTYSWGNGHIPREMRALFAAFEQQETRAVVTAVFGTGDSFYPHFCGAVDQFRDMLYVHTDLAVTLKVELLPQEQDVQRCQAFVERLMTRLNQHLEQKSIFN
ncbi:putative flavodoxin-1 [Pullulanibacillus camelliae]|uniref:Putative flavodoxin-1 n=1 Tax=Pullulanibacillus camelliae TaxID=1707096 RepID=A0A8J2YKH0_9BACL|nr:flavodoxin domain-containing protein [Pullulanibacillus camelliae]GGE51085.1 putative flavodoxin-1 [Pullulanibacillus camelliae]